MEEKLKAELHEAVGQIIRLWAGDEWFYCYHEVRDGVLLLEFKKTGAPDRLEDFQIRKPTVEEIMEDRRARVGK